MRQHDLTQGSIFGNIAAFSLPYLLSCFLQIFYGLADLFFVGRYCGVSTTTAVAVGSQVMHMVTVVLVGLAMGSTVKVAHYAGAGDRQGTSLAIGNSITLFAVISVIFSALSLAGVDDLIRWLSAPAEAVTETRQYLVICFLGIPIIVAYNIVASIYRGLGDSRSPMYFVAVACVVNVLLDYLLVGPAGLGARGAAWATIAAQAVSVAVALLSIRRKRGSVQMRRQYLKPDLSMMRQLLHIGLPVALQDGFIQIGFLFITMIANMRGLDDAAAVGIVEKMIGIFFLIPSAMLATVSAMAAQNFGAHRVDRAVSTLWHAVAVCAAVGTAASLVTQFFSSELVGMFTDHPHVIALGGDYLRVYVWDCVVAGIHFCFSGFFCACGRSIFSFVHNIISMGTFRVPGCYWASIHYPATLMPMGAATILGSTVSVLICLGMFFWLRGRLQVQYAPHDNPLGN
ncbi:MAG: MATE family efflux transporter [Paludibacteraceae bacterium]|nr:MATE family efflux transporter [Paludibacteraceae bacterium]